MLLLDANLHAGGFGTFPQLGHVLEPFSRSPRERNVRRRRVKDEKRIEARALMLPPRGTFRGGAVIDDPGRGNVNL